MQVQSLVGRLNLQALQHGQKEKNVEVKDVIKLRSEINKVENADRVVRKPGLVWEKQWQNIGRLLSALSTASIPCIIEVLRLSIKQK